MSRLGAMSVQIPKEVKVHVDGSIVTVEGPKGTLNINVRPEIDVVIEGEEVITSVKVPSKKSGSYWGLTRSLISNMIDGVTKGFEKRLEMIGVGYRATQKGPRGITITVGYSHPIDFEAPDGVTLKVEENQNIVVSGADKHLVGLTAAKLRELRKPEPYKGKGIKYVDEVVKRKAGKAGKVGLA